MSKNHVWYLQQIDLFEGISPKEIKSIAKSMVEKTCKTKEVLYTPFEKVDSIYLLKKGEISVYYYHYGKKLIMDILMPGAIFGNIGFEDSKSTHFAEVTEDATICIFSKEDFVNIMQSKPELMIRLFNLLSDRLNNCESKVVSLLFDAKEKILHYLETEREKQEKLKLFSKIFSKRVTHERLAQHTGLSRETVTRAIQDLKKEGKIGVNPDGEIELNCEDCLQP